MIRALCLVCGLAAGGCAQHRNQSAYAPPLAPPVYPQPPLATQPVAFPAPPAVQPAVQPAVPMMQPGYPPAGMPAGPAAMMPSAAIVPALPDGSCPPCDAGAVPVVFEGTIQTAPCPPGP